MYVCSSQNNLKEITVLYNKSKILLSSSSIYRQALLRKIIRHFDCESPDIDESAHINESPSDLVCRLSEQKSKALRKKYPQHIIIASDQVACIEDPKATPKKILGKPHTVENAIKQLRECAGKTVNFYTGITVSLPDSLQTTEYEIFSVRFRPLNDSQIKKYIAIENPLDCAGSFKSEGLGIALFESLSGRDPNTLIGLPLMLLCDILARHNIDVLDLA